MPTPEQVTDLTDLARQLDPDRQQQLLDEARRLLEEQHKSA